MATRKDVLILTLKSAHDIESPRVAKHEQVSAHRWHLEVKLQEPEEIDRELVGWLKDAYELSA